MDVFQQLCHELIKTHLDNMQGTADHVKEISMYMLSKVHGELSWHDLEGMGYQPTDSNQVMVLNLWRHVTKKWDLWGMNERLKSWETPGLVKSLQSCKSFRAEGKRFFSKKDYEKALKSYTKMILFAPPDSEELAVAFANHSAVLFEQKKFENCLVDIDLASATKKYPEKRLHLLLFRKGRCLIHLCRRENAKAVFMEVEKVILSLSDGTMKKWKEKIDDELKRLPEEMDEDNPKVVEDGYEVNRKEEIPQIDGHNSELPNCSPKIELRMNNTRGRHLVALKDIEVGEVLIVGNAYASVLKSKFYSTHCHHCHAELENVVPCRKCSHVQYCSASCCETSWQTYHSIECQHLDLFKGSHVEHLALRALLVAGKDKVIKQLNRMKNGHDNHLNTDCDKCMNESDYQFVCCLKEGFLPPQVIPTVHLASILITKLLISEGYLQDFPGKIRESAETPLLIESLIFKHIKQVLVTAHGHYNPPCKRQISDKPFPLIAVYMVTVPAMLNHSCQPNVFVVRPKNSKAMTMVMRASKDIKPGDELLTSYEFKELENYGMFEVEKRKEFLQHGWQFDCRCSLCRDGGKIEQESMHGVACPRCHGPIIVSGHVLHSTECEDCCLRIDSTQSYWKSMYNSKHDEDFENGMREFGKMGYEKASIHLRKCYEARTKYLYKYNILITQVSIPYSVCLLFMGKNLEAMKVGETAVQILERCCCSSTSLSYYLLFQACLLEGCLKIIVREQASERVICASTGKRYEEFQHIAKKAERVAFRANLYLRSSFHHEPERTEPSYHVLKCLAAYNNLVNCSCEFFDVCCNVLVHEMPPGLNMSMLSTAARNALDATLAMVFKKAELKLD